MNYYDKGSFIVVPNQRSVMGVSAAAQALYMWLCFFANQDGECFPSRPTLAEKLNCSVRSVDEYFKELEGVGLATKEARFRDGAQTSNVYRLPLYGLNAATGRENPALPPAQKLPTELNPVLTQELSESEIRTEFFDPNTEDQLPKKEKRDVSYRKIFELWGKYPLNWRANRTEIAAAQNLLAEQGLEEVKSALGFYNKVKGQDFMIKIVKPSDLDRKWKDLELIYDKQHG